MKIVADENIPLVNEAFAEFGEIITVPGRTISNAMLADAEVLLIRSVTNVDAELLKGTAVTFVGTASIGYDHVDVAHLGAEGIHFASAPGSNANSVAEYVAAALLVLAEEREFTLNTRRLGIAGHGNVGKKVEAKARALGIECVINDPPLARATGSNKYRPLDDLADCDIVTVHVPLETGGSDPTLHLIDHGFIQLMKTGVIVINTSRGAVADGGELQAALEDGRVGAAVLDVWEGEPAISREQLANCALGTPHIAGYSYDGKVNGTRMLYEALCRFHGKEPAWDPEPLLPPPPISELAIDACLPPEEAVREAVLAVYDIRLDDNALRATMMNPPDERADLFDTLRKTYRQRREFHNTRVTLSEPSEALEHTLAGLGFRVG